MSAPLRELRTGQWKGNLWGCDYPMMAMTAARLGKPKEAVDWLLLSNTPQRAIHQTVSVPAGICRAMADFSGRWR